MGLFDPPAIALRNRLPKELIAEFDTVDEFAYHTIQFEKEQHRPYQLGVVLALWIKAGDLTGDIELSRMDYDKVQAVYESCMKVLREDSYICFKILTDLANQGQTFGVSPEIYQQLGHNVLF
jgi:hypothetical protein